MVKTNVPDFKGHTALWNSILMKSVKMSKQLGQIMLDNKSCKVL